MKTSLRNPPSPAYYELLLKVRTLIDSEASIEVNRSGSGDSAGHRTNSSINGSPDKKLASDRFTSKDVEKIQTTLKPRKVSLTPPLKQAQLQLEKTTSEKNATPPNLPPAYRFHDEKTHVPVVDRYLLSNSIGPPVIDARSKAIALMKRGDPSLAQKPGMSAGVPPPVFSSAPPEQPGAPPSTFVTWQPTRGKITETELKELANLEKQLKKLPKAEAAMIQNIIDQLKLSNFSSFHKDSTSFYDSRAKTISQKIDYELATNGYQPSDRLEATEPVHGDEPNELPAYESINNP